jgi:signal recognition particle subunit SRP72
LPPFESLLENVDIDGLEAQFNLLGTKYAKAKITDSKLSKTPGDLSKNADLVKNKKKKNKKKVKLPKNIEGNVPIDAERWLPLRERSYYKGRRKKKGTQVGKGTQGAVAR